MTSENKQGSKLLERLGESFEEGLFSSEVSSEEIDELTRATGADPDMVADRGRALAAAVFEEGRLSWQTEAQKKIETDADKEEINCDHLDDEGVVAYFESLQSDPELAGIVSGYHHNRTEGASSPTELRKIIKQIEKLKRRRQPDG